MSQKRPSFRAACEWIAANDEDTYTDPAEIVIESGMTCALIADLFGCWPEYVAERVARIRTEGAPQ
jgi:hypothetical protein